MSCLQDLHAHTQVLDQFGLDVLSLATFSMHFLKETETGKQTINYCMDMMSH